MQEEDDTLPGELRLEDQDQITRLEVIGDGRELVRHRIRIRHVLRQDNGRTLKIFIENDQENAQVDRGRQE